MDIFWVITLVLIIAIISTLGFYIISDILVRKRSDKEFKKSINKQVVEIESRKNKIRVMGNDSTEFEKTEFAEKKHAKK